jgi:hypothetical protein
VRILALAAGAAFLAASWVVLPGLASRLAVEGPSLNVIYHDSGAITVMLDGARVGADRAPGTVIPAGTYNVVFDPSSKSLHQFHIRGPGVNFTVGPGDASDGMCGGSGYLYGPYKVTLLPNSTYIYQDDYQPDVIRQVFSTSNVVVGTATASGSGSTGGSGAAKPQPSGKVITGTPLFGGDSASKTVGFRGALAANVDTRGRLTLSQKGRRVASLSAGRYRITVLDETSKAGFLVQRQGSKPVTLSPVANVGKRTVLLRLGAGRWSFYSPQGARTYFKVVA